MRMRLFVILCALAVLLGLSTPSFAQTPTKQTMIDIAKTCPVAFNSNGTFKNAPVTDAFRRTIIPYLAAKLNERDGANNWGVLYRMDRQDETPEPGRLTTDVVIDRRNRNHYDVLSDNSVSWSLIGPLPNDKDWFIQDPSQHATICPGGTPPPPPPPPPPPVDLTAILNRLGALEAENGVLRDLVNRLQSLVNETQGRVNTVAGEVDLSNARITALEQKPAPAFPALKCSGRASFGIPITCNVVPAE